MHVSDVVVHGELVFQIVFVREDVDHPAEDHRHEGAAFRLACFRRMDGPEHPELGMLSVILLHLVGRRPAEIHMLMPARDAQRMRWFSSSSVALVLSVYITPSSLKCWVGVW